MTDVALDTLPGNPVLTARPVLTRMSYLHRVIEDATKKKDTAALGRGLDEARATIAATRIVGARIDETQQTALMGSLDELLSAITSADTVLNRMVKIAESASTPVVPEEGPSEPPAPLQKEKTVRGVLMDNNLTSPDRKNFVDAAQKLTLKGLAIGVAAVIADYVSKRQEIVDAYLSEPQADAQAAIEEYQGEAMGVLNLLIRVLYYIGDFQRSSGRYLTKAALENAVLKDAGVYYTSRVWILLAEAFEKGTNNTTAIAYDPEKVLTEAKGDLGNTWKVMKAEMFLVYPSHKPLETLLVDTDSLASIGGEKSKKIMLWKMMKKTGGKQLAGVIVDLGLARLMVLLHALGIPNFSDYEIKNPAVFQVFRYVQSLLIEEGVWYWKEVFVDPVRIAEYKKAPDDTRKIEVAEFPGNQLQNVRGKFPVDARAPEEVLDVADAAEHEDDDLDAELDGLTVPTAKDAIELGARDQWMDW